MVEVYVCKCCGHKAKVSWNRPLAPTIPASKQVNCETPGCANWKRTTDTRDTADIDLLFLVIVKA